MKQLIFLSGIVLLLALAGCNNADILNDSGVDQTKITGQASENEIILGNETPPADNTIGSGNIPVQSGERINIQNLLELGYDELLELFGEPIEEISEMYFRVYFDNGLIVDVGASVILDFAQVSSLQGFHFNGIDGASVYNDIMALFGQPVSIRESSTEEHYGAVKSYAYEIQEASEYNPPHFVRFYFDTDDNLMAIQFFIPA